MNITIKQRYTGAVLYKGPKSDLRRANLRSADLRGANLRSAYLSGAYLSGADLSGANLSGTNLSGADLIHANLIHANLSSAYLSGAELRCMGNMREIRTMQIDTWEIGYTSDTLQIGCQRHAIKRWRKWDTEAGQKWIADMDSEAAAWAERNMALVLAIIDANPATPTGHKVTT